MSTLVLASGSPRRRSLLAELGVDFSVQPCPLGEPPDCPSHVRPAAWAQSLAYFKARCVAEAAPEDLVLGADTVVACAGRLLGKPRNAAEARRMLTLQAGRESRVITGVALVRVRTGPTVGAVERLISSDVTRVVARDDPAFIERYLASGAWVGKAGAYGAQDTGDAWIGRIEGSFTNVVGLPIELVGRMLARFSTAGTDDPGSSAVIP